MPQPTTRTLRARNRFETSNLRQVANQMFARASGAELRAGNRIRLLKNAAENYPAWLDAIRSARARVHLEMYIIHEDAQGRLFADALIDKARQGVRVRVLYDWLGGFRNTSRAFWTRMRDAGVEVRCYNPPRFESPLGWVSRDHRKLIIVDRDVAFVTGLCIGQRWAGDPARGRDPWRDTGVEVRGPALPDLEEAFAEAWQTAGPPLAGEDLARTAASGSVRTDDGQTTHDGVALRVVATVPNTAGLFRVDQLVAGLARRTLWLTDAYYAGTTPYVQALRAAAQDGVDVRLLVPGSSDVPIVSPFSRAGYRPLLEAGVRVFEWKGSMLHAKTAVADGRWARVGSTNLNLTSWIGNRELDVIVEDEPFARQMEAMYIDDLVNATEIVLDDRHRVSTSSGAGRGQSPRPGGGSGGRAMAGAMRIGSALSAAVTNRRVLEPVEAYIALAAGASLAALGVLAFFFPRAVAYPFAVLTTWPAVALLIRGIKLLRELRGTRRTTRVEPRTKTRR
jgi:cardiolipin synthase